MHTCISSHGLKRSWCLCPRRVNAGTKNTPSTHHPRRRNVTTLMVGLKNGHIRKNLTQKWWTPEIYLGNTKKKPHTLKKKLQVSDANNIYEDEREVGKFFRYIQRKSICHLEQTAGQRNCVCFWNVYSPPHLQFTLSVHACLTLPLPWHVVDLFIHTIPQPLPAVVFIDL